MIRTRAILAGVLGVLCSSSVHADDHGRPTGPRRSSNVFVELGMTARYLTGSSSTRVAARSEGAAPPTSRWSDGDVGLTAVERLGVRLAPTLYLAGEVELGTGLVISDDPDGGRSFLIGGLGVVGLRGPLPFGSVAVEIAGGGRVVHESSASLDTWDQAVVEVRGRGALRLSRWCSLGVVGGKSLLVRDEWMGGVFLGVDAH